MSKPICRIAALAVALCCLFGAPMPAQALDNAKAAGSLAQRAARAFEDGKMDEAATLYLNAFHLAANPAYLYAAARAADLGGQREAAAEHYRKYLELETVDHARLTKAREAVARIAKEVANALAADAERQTRAGHHAGAAATYQRAFAGAPARWDLLLSCAQAWQAAGNLDQARNAVRQYLRDAPQDAPGRPVAVQMQADLQPKLAAPTRAQTIETPGKSNVVGGQTPQPRSTTTGWLLAGAGGGLGLAGLAVWWASGSDRDTYAKNTERPDGGKVTAWSYAEATARAESLRRREVTAVVLGGAGLAAAGVGTWLVLRVPTKVSLAPGPVPAGAGLVWRF